MMGRPRALAACLASLLVASPVMAQPKSPPSRPPQELANDLVKQAITKSQAKDHLGAIDLYLQAYSLIPQHTLLSNVGSEYQQAGKPVEALKYFCMYLDKDPTGTNATYALAKAKAIQHDLGNKNVDDTTACKPATKPEPLPRPKADPLPNNTEVTGTKNLGVTESAGGGGGGGGGGLKYVGIGIAGAGVVTLGVGVFFGLKAKQKSDFISNYTEEHPGMAWPEDVNQIEKDGQTYEDRQIRLMIGGGVLAVAGAIVYVIGASKGSKTEKLSVKPTATPSSIGVSLGRGF